MRSLRLTANSLRTREATSGEAIMTANNADDEAVDSVSVVSVKSVSVAFSIRLKEEKIDMLLNIIFLFLYFQSKNLNFGVVIFEKKCKFRIYIENNISEFCQW